MIFFRAVFPNEVIENVLIVVIRAFQGTKLFQEYRIVPTTPSAYSEIYNQHV